MRYLRRIATTLFPTAFLRNSRTVHYAFSFLFLFAAVLGMAAVSTKDGSGVRVVASQAVVAEGTVFTVDVFVFAAAPVNAVDISVAFPQSQVEVLGIDKGESVITLWTEEPYVANGSVILRGGTYKKGFVGDHKIATINVKAKASGKAEFISNDVKLLAGDGKGTSIKADKTEAIARTQIIAAGDTIPTTISSDVQVVLVTDIDGDGTVSLRDISSFMASWATKDVRYDFNNDGTMTFRDFSILLSDYFSK